jgi:hypothetical protein
MREELLQFIWRWQYYNQHELLSEAGEALQVLVPGELNIHQGPDFLNAQVRIGDTLLAGSVELHIAASDWDRHAHSADLHYRNVVLHVVWENDLGPGSGDATEGREDAMEGRGGAAEGREDAAEGRDNAAEGRGSVRPVGAKFSRVKEIPMLVLQHRVPKLLLGQYTMWMKSRVFVPCAAQLPQVDASIWTEWKERLLTRRLDRRVGLIRSWLEENRQHWEETTWWLFARNFGLPVNGAAFEAIGRSLPVRLLGRYRGDLFRLEALLMGQAGLLDRDVSGGAARSDSEGLPEVHLMALREEYTYLRKKHRLSPITTPPVFLRMRPAHFPTVRLAQLAAVLSRHTAWFAAILEADSSRELEPWLRVEGLGATMRKSLLINTFVPLSLAYAVLRGKPAFREKALRWLSEARAESNSMLTGWTRLGIVNKNAADSQALLELKKEYCDGKKCLDCAIGKLLLGRTRGV